MYYFTVKVTNRVTGDYIISIILSNDTTLKTSILTLLQDTFISPDMVQTMDNKIIMGYEDDKRTYCIPLETIDYCKGG